MKRRKLPLILGAASILIGGLGFAQDVAGLSDDSLAALTVPAGRLGDRVEYAMLEHGADPRSNGLAIEVNVTGVTVDRSGVPRDTVLVAQRATAPPPIAGFEVNEVAQTQHVDLAGRDVVRLDQAHEAVGAVARFAPDGATLRASELPFWSFQGRHLQTGTNWTSHVGCRGGQPAASYEERVLRAGRLAGRDALELRRTTTYAFEDPQRGEVTVSLEQTVYVTAAHAYPERIETTRTETHGETSVRATQTLWLTSYTPGHEPIPWRATAARDCSRPALERSGEAAYFPHLGTGSRFGFSLEQAHASALQDASMVSFVAWRQLNPEAKLVGAGFFRKSPEPTGGTPRDQWALYFASQEEVRLVLSQRDDDTGAIVNHELPVPQPPRLPSIAPDALPKDPLTIGQMGRIFDDVARFRWANYDSFSYGYNGPLTGKCDPHVPCKDPTEPWYYTYQQLGRIQTLEKLPAQRQIRAVLEFNLTTGEVVFYREEQYTGPHLPPPSEPIVPLVAPSGAPAGGVPTFVAFGVAAGGILLALAIALFDPARQLLARIFSHFRFSRLERSTVLDHRLRDDLRALISRDPGITAPQLQAAVGSPWSTLIYHLGVLERQAIVTSLVQGRHKRYFAFGALDWSARAAVGVLRDPNTNRALGVVKARPGLTQAQVAGELGITAQAVGRHLQRLQAVKLVTRRRQGRAIRVFPVATSVEAETAKEVKA